MFVEEVEATTCDTTTNAVITIIMLFQKIESTSIDDEIAVILREIFFVKFVWINEDVWFWLSISLIVWLNVFDFTVTWRNEFDDFFCSAKKLCFRIDKGLRLWFWSIKKEKLNVSIDRRCCSAKTLRNRFDFEVSSMTNLWSFCKLMTNELIDCRLAKLRKTFEAL